MGNQIIAHLVLTHKWFDETVSGGKRIEYRKMSPHWERILWRRREKITHVRFSRGYTKTQVVFRVDKIDIGTCSIDGWGDEYYRVHFS